MIAFITALFLTWLHITILSVISSPALSIQLVIITIILAFRYEQISFGWQMALIAGILFDLFSGIRFGIFISLFVITAMLAESSFNWVEKWGLNLTTWLTTTISTLIYMITVMALTGYSLVSGLGSIIISVLATVIALQIIASLLDHFNRKGV